MAFSFGFSGEDVVEDDGGVGEQNVVGPSTAGEAGNGFVGLPAAEHKLDEMVGTRISCSISIGFFWLFLWLLFVVGRAKGLSGILGGFAGKEFVISIAGHV